MYALPLATRFRFRNDILPVSSSSNNRNAFKISSRESEKEANGIIKSRVTTIKSHETIVNQGWDDDKSIMHEILHLIKQH